MKITETHERLLVMLIALHSAIVGIMLLFFAEWSISFAGWTSADPIFFVHQGGIFHIVLAAGYVLEYRRDRGITLLVVAKTCACIFLVAEALIGDTPWVIPFSGLTDGAMGLVVWITQKMVGRT